MFSKLDVIETNVLKVEIKVKSIKVTSVYLSTKTKS